MIVQFLVAFMASLCATLMASGLIVLVGFLFRTKIKALVSGNDLGSSATIPNIKIEKLMLVGDAKGNYPAYLLLENIGDVGVSNIKKYIWCDIDNGVLLYPLQTCELYKWVNAGHGERVQLQVSFSDLCFIRHISQKQRLFLEVVDEKGIAYRKMAYIESNWKLVPQAIVRVKRLFPNRKRAILGQKRVEDFTRKYSVDTSVG